MSERGSFVTEFIYCPKCFEAVKHILLAREKYLCSIVLPGWGENAKEMPIIAGRVGGLYPGEELFTFDFDLNEKLAKVICHPLRIAVLGDTGEKIFTVIPNNHSLEADRK